MRRSPAGRAILLICVSISLLLSLSHAAPACTANSPPACCFQAPSSGNFYDLSQAYLRAPIFPVMNPLTGRQSTPEITCRHPRPMVRTSFRALEVAARSYPARD